MHQICSNLPWPVANCGVGATTLDEYRPFIEKGALERFQPVLVLQPGVEDTVSI